MMNILRVVRIINKILKSLQENTKQLKESFNDATDFRVRKLKIGSSRSLMVHLIYLDGAVNKDSLQENVITPLLYSTKVPINKNSIIEDVSENILKTAEVFVVKEYKELTDAIVNGGTVILFEGIELGIIAGTTQFKERNIEQATSERSAKGARVGLTENLNTNISLLRGMVKTPSFCVESLKIGTLSDTEISILYIKKVVDQNVLAEVRKRIDKISVNYVLESMTIKEAIEGETVALFTMYEDSERPDVVISSLYDGKVVVLVDGNPYAIILPGLFISIFQAPDEYNQKYGRLMNRLLRFTGFVLSIYLPSIYVILINFYADGYPGKVTKILLKNDELLPAFWTMLILIGLITILIDVIFRVPQSAIILISLFATIAIGETAVSAKIIHPVSLIVIAITFLSGFLIINKQLGSAIATLRISFLIVGNYFGSTGMIIATTLLIIYMASLRSVGVPFLSPLLPFKLEELKDTIYRGRLEKLNNSKHSFPNDNE
ncbi:spore germination protein [Peribacillus muralis]|uniref:spore germination protein n=1 Tax=Peribacillus muralis TaxID=264697 RepID=UPI001F4DCB6A|nr:spore germination protein [Peribacillus muralis]MCK1995150.1 spore germination protein [Peribacillus muralis]MCK2015767.1 spore germination protein [Peribacillus muralis]